MVTFSTRDLKQNFLSPIFLNTLNVGLPSFMFTRWWMQCMEREHAKQVPKTTFFSITLLVIVALTLKAVRNNYLFQTFYLGSLILIIFFVSVILSLHHSAFQSFRPSFFHFCCLSVCWSFSHVGIHL